MPGNDLEVMSSQRAALPPNRGSARNVRGVGCAVCAASQRPAGVGMSTGGDGPAPAADPVRRDRRTRGRPARRQRSCAHAADCRGASGRREHAALNSDTRLGGRPLSLRTPESKAGPKAIYRRLDAGSTLANGPRSMAMDCSSVLSATVLRALCDKDWRTSNPRGEGAPAPTERRSALRSLLRPLLEDRRHRRHEAGNQHDHERGGDDAGDVLAFARG